ncbi:hypothetical protein C482_06989 [Natrialba chahannaoensis JCM 10990]|uniref:Uncharacterized protein n=1 Tax=Natrialba chahannaoensis JCM 10990 TaxID=1227492 RepID=M0ASL1_9EURY|nr:DUF5807 family protein [Natrialba chahannaoensis]ELZ01500.1 hypothetical protein C482_06989 [Natrialba chahannaoensis JCM 10990]
MSTPREEFLAGERPDDIALFLAESYVSDDRLESFGESVEDGVLIIVDGDRGRNAFEAATDSQAMEFAQSAMGLEGLIDSDLAGGRCPERPAGDATSDGDACGEGDNHDHNHDHDHEHNIQYVFAFAEEQNEDVGGIYADGDVVHAYAQCSCGTAFSDRWNVQTLDS